MYAHTPSESRVLSSISICHELYYLFSTNSVIWNVSWSGIGCIYPLTLSESRVLSSISTCHELYHLYFTNALHQNHEFYHLYLYVTNSIIYISRTHSIRVASSIVYIFMSRTLWFIFHELCNLYSTNLLHQSHEFYHLYLYVTNAIIYIFIHHELCHLHYTHSIRWLIRDSCMSHEWVTNESWMTRSWLTFVTHSWLNIAQYALPHPPLNPPPLCMTHSWLIHDSFVTNSWLVRDSTYIFIPCHIPHGIHSPH